MTDEEIKALAALADEHLAILEPSELDIWHHWDTGYRDAANPLYIKALIERLRIAEAENENVRKANLYCADLFNQMKDDLADAYRALVCLVDHDLRDPHWDYHCRVLEKARYAITNCSAQMVENGDEGD